MHSCLLILSGATQYLKDAWCIDVVGKQRRKTRLWPVSTGLALRGGKITSQTYKRAETAIQALKNLACPLKGEQELIRREGRAGELRVEKGQLKRQNESPAGL